MMVIVVHPILVTSDGTFGLDAAKKSVGDKTASAS